MNHKRISQALVFLPALTLLAIVSLHTFHYFNGQEIIFKISGYDPRDLFAGHYLQYQIDYGIEIKCDRSIAKACLCFTAINPPSGYFAKDCQKDQCKTIIQGQCHYDTFTSGLERYYIPEEKSKELDAKLRKEGARIKVVVPESGFPLVKEMIWK